MLSKSAARAFFLGGTLIVSAVFVGLTVDTLGQIPERSNASEMTEAVKRGHDIWTDNNCMGCHTLLGEGAYYAPELTKVVDRRGAEWIKVFIKDPEAMYPGRRKMVKYGFNDTEIADLVRSLHHKVIRRLMRIGVIHDDPDADDDFAREEPMLARYTSASMLDRVAIGEREGELVWRERIEPPQIKQVGRLCAIYEGFNIHARTTVSAYARDRLEQLIRYVARSAVCLERLDLLKNGLVRMRLRNTWSDGTVAKIFDGSKARHAEG